MDWKTGLKRGPFSSTQIDQLAGLLAEMDSGQLQWLNGFLMGVETMATGAVVEPESSNDLAEPVWILYGSHTGNCERLAKVTSERLSELGIAVKISDMGSFKIRELQNIRKLLVIVSTHGIGEPPAQAAEFYDFLHSKKAPELRHIHYSVLALGDTGYVQFCQTGKDIDLALEKLGGHSIMPRVDCDVDFEDDYAQWCDAVISKLTAEESKPVRDPIKLAAKMPESGLFNRKNPYLANISKRINLNGRGSSRETLHMEIDIRGSGLKYEPGDAVGIYAENSPALVESVLDLLKFSGEEIVETWHGKKSLYQAMTMDYEVTPLTSVPLGRYAELTSAPKLLNIVSDNENVQQYVYGRDIYDLLREIPYGLAPDEFISLLRKNAPRMYSVASSQDVVGDQVHILASVVRYHANGRSKSGHCSSYLSDRVYEEDQIKVFIDPNTRFRLPEETNQAIIMVGAGTGIAPYRAFIQHREMQANSGRSWLFFGERNFTTDFFYQTEWLQYIKEGKLTRADVAFSRDQESKVYVQHKLEQQGKDLFDWLEGGAHFYVCGDAKKMARDVDDSLKKIIMKHGDMNLERAEEYVKYLQVADRYQTDIY